MALSSIRFCTFTEIESCAYDEKMLDDGALHLFVHQLGHCKTGRFIPIRAYSSDGSKDTFDDEVQVRV
jgi:hypothetical protein